MANQLVEELKNIIVSAWDDTIPTKRLGSGAYGVVFECEKRAAGTSLVTKEAVKVIKIPRDYDEDYDEDSGIPRDEYYTKLKDGAVKEIETMVNLKSPHIVHINEYKIVEQKNQFGWFILIKMDLLKNLRDVMKIHANDSKEDTEASVKKLCLDMCDALEVCFNSGYVHRDIKPENIFVSDKGEYYLGDFGLAKQLKERAKNVSSRGTETYIAPEAYTAGCSQITDLYSLGLVLYKMANNNCDVFQKSGDNAISKDIAQTIRLSGKEPIQLPANCSQPLGEIICKMCAYAPQDRYQSIAEIRSALRNIQPKSQETDEKVLANSDNKSSSKEENKESYIPGNGVVNVNNNTINYNNNIYAQANVTSIKDNSIQFRNKAALFIILGAALIALVLFANFFLISRIKERFSSPDEEVLITTESETPKDVNSDESITDDLSAETQTDDNQKEESVKLINEKIVDSYDAEVRKDVENSLGDIYDKALVVGSALSSFDQGGDAYATFYLGKGYARFAGNFSCLEDSKIKSEEYTLEIIGDDEDVPLYKQKYSRATPVTMIDIDVTGVEFLTIRVSGGSFAGLVLSDGMLCVDGSQVLNKTSTKDWSDSKLVAMKIVDSKNAEVQTDVENSLGDIYDKALVVGSALNPFARWGDAYATFYLGKGYERFAGNFSCLEDSDIESEDYTLEIIGDDEDVPLYKQKYSRATPVTAIDIDVTGVEFLTIRVTGGSYAGLVLSDGMLLVKGDELNTDEP